MYDSFNLNQKNMLNKTHKVTLKADIFKNNKTPDKRGLNSSKSPIVRKNISQMNAKQSQKKADSNQLFQKVCCPNCHFLFKIVKEQAAPAKFNNTKFITATSEKTSQTEQLQTQRLNFGKLKEKLQKQSKKQKDYLFLDSQKSINEQSKLSDGGDSVRLRNLSNSFEELDYIRSITPTSNKQVKFAADNKTSSNNSQAQLVRKSRDHRSSFAVSELLMNKKSLLEQTLVKIAINTEKDKTILQQFQQFYIDLPQSIQVPGYQKMLFGAACQ